ncbi:MAG: bifunctional hydroxymethylpyrimidine kinase/phosphomethylpyrimidine kinase [Hyphomicrobiales bacterium]|nr:bifunctional hydroxymethylpyrimidine kinase/phosphomethylpyrimidine kinase [Hyphomicrobiales bacterium]
MNRIPNVLAIAGSDPSGGAGVQADIKTFAALGCHGMAAVTALTAQNTTGVAAIHLPPPDFVASEVDAVFDDIAVDAVKIGMLADAAIARSVARTLARRHAANIVLDPVLAASSGDSLAADGLIGALLADVLPLARLVTPNLAEAARLTGGAEPRSPAEMRQAGAALLNAGAQAVLVKGGHLDGPIACDLLVTREGVRMFEARRVDTRNTHGTGCTLSSAIAAFLAHGRVLEQAIEQAKGYLVGALAGADRLSVGRGPGPLHHFHALWKKDDP